VWKNYFLQASSSHSIRLPHTSKREKGELFQKVGGFIEVERERRSKNKGFFSSTPKISCGKRGI